MMFLKPSFTHPPSYYQPHVVVVMKSVQGPNKQQTFGCHHGAKTKCCDSPKTVQEMTTNGTTSCSNMGYYNPPHQMYELDDNSFQFVLDLPGVKRSDIQIDIVNTEIILVQAERTQEPKKTVTKYLKKFMVDKRKWNVKESKAKLENGVLYITVPKKKPIDPVIVNITTSPLHDMDAEYVANNKYRELLSLDLPGVVLGDLKVQFHEGTILVHAKRTKGVGKRIQNNISKKFLYDEDKVNDLSKVRGHLMNGVLTLLLIVDDEKKDTSSSDNNNETAVAALETVKIEITDGSSAHHKETVESSSSNDDSTFTMIDSTGREASKEE